jgi:hypothetical protein
MIVFVSYARRDNRPAELRAIEMVAARLGTVYIDDVHGYEAADRRAAVESALQQASVLVGVVTPHYLRTPWTCREFAIAVQRNIPIIALLPDGRLVPQDDYEWPWRDIVATFAGAAVSSHALLSSLEAPLHDLRRALVS